MLEPSDIHPGAVLRDFYLTPEKLTPAALAWRIDVPAELIEEIIAGRALIEPEIAEGLGAVLAAPASFWLELSARRALWEARTISQRILRRCADDTFHH